MSEQEKVVEPKEENKKPDTQTDHQKKPREKKEGYKPKQEYVKKGEH